MGHAARHQVAAALMAAGIVLVACRLPLWSPTATPTAHPARLPPTPTPVGVAATSYALEFTQVSSSGMATMTAHAHSCSGLAGPWQGQVDLEFAIQNLHFTASGPWSFALSEGHAEGEVVLSGSGGADQCLLSQVSDPLRFEIELNESGSAAHLRMGSVGAGTMTIVCPEAPSVTIPFAAAWGNEAFEVSLQPYSACSGSP